MSFDYKPEQAQYLLNQLNYLLTFLNCLHCLGKLTDCKIPNFYKVYQKNFPPLTCVINKKILLNL